MTVKLKPIEAKIASANGSRTTKSLAKRSATAVMLPSPSAPKFGTDQQPETTKLNEKKTSITSKSEVTKETTSNNQMVETNEENNPQNQDAKDEEGGNDVENRENNSLVDIPDVYKTQGTMTYSSCTGYSESTCLCSSIDDSLQQSTLKRVSYLERRNWITTERLSELRKKAQDAIKHHKIFSIRGCFYSIRKGLVQRGWVEKLDIHRRSAVNGSCQVILEDLAQHLPQRRPGETRRQHIQKYDPFCIVPCTIVHLAHI